MSNELFLTVKDYENELNAYQDVINDFWQSYMDTLEIEFREIAMMNFKRMVSYVARVTRAGYKVSKQNGRWIIRSKEA